MDQSLGILIEPPPHRTWWSERVLARVGSVDAIVAA